MSEVKLMAITKPVVDGVDSAEEFIAYCARVSNPGNQINNETAPKLLRYLAKHKHWSPFEQVFITMSITTTRDIGRQILRHRSFSFQEFSQRYAVVNDAFEIRDARMQDQKNRQNSIPCTDGVTSMEWTEVQDVVADTCKRAYEWAIDKGIAKEQARAVLPEGMTKSTMYMSGTLRSWIHYCDLRGSNGTQLEHMDIAKKAWAVILEEFPSLSSILDIEETPKQPEPKQETITKDVLFAMMDEWAKKTLPPIPKPGQGIPAGEPPAQWDTLGGKPMIKRGH